ncbi:glycosyltransferase [Paeniglutamicibacter gangotriensis]|uniref:Glycosyltransferase n=2 Tax=Paeniglutamicibacter gangotriensis TaxID=254787 RepID=A0A5B0EJ73_9MICC|nr:glycosyltransferase [Paeniglutamicibacter gangotriensis]
MRRTYLFALKDAGGTVPPEIGVARRLAARGHNVVVLGDYSMAEQATGVGAMYRPWTDGETGEVRDWALHTPTALARDMFQNMIGGRSPQQARDTASAIDEVRPDLVLTSFFAFGAMVAAESRTVPFDVLLPNTYPMPAKGMPQVGTGFAPATGPLGALRDCISRFGGTKLVDRYALAPLNELRAEYGLSPLATTWDQVHHAKSQLILTSPAFDFPAELPANAHYVGPILDDPAWTTDAQWAPPTGETPLVVVAMSSTFQNHLQCMQRIVDALGGLPVRGLVTTGPAIAPEEIHPPGNVTVLRAVPHYLAMEQANLVITHGGHGTVVKALAAGVPMVILHHGRDQAGNAIRVTSRGAGLKISRRASSRRIAKAVTQVLGNDSYRRAAGELGRAVARDAADQSTLLGCVER